MGVISLVALGTGIFFQVSVDPTLQLTKNRPAERPAVGARPAVTPRPPVAIAAGHALHNLRNTAGLAEPLPMSHIVWGGVRDLDPLEADRFDEYAVQQFSVPDIREISTNLKKQYGDLAERVDVIYVHIDMDVLDPSEVPGHNLTVPDGPSSRELAAALTWMFGNPKTAALGIASTPSFNLDPGGISRQAALNLIEGAIRGAEARSKR